MLWYDSMIIKRAKMVEYRSHIQIVGDILTTTSNDLPTKDGAGVTYLMRKANVPYSRITIILDTLVSHGLLERTGSNSRFRWYRISQSGREFLQAYNKFTHFANSFGLNI